MWYKKQLASPTLFCDCLRFGVEGAGICTELADALAAQNGYFVCAYWAEDKIVAAVARLNRARLASTLVFIGLAGMMPHQVIRLN